MLAINRLLQRVIIDENRIIRDEFDICGVGSWYVAPTIDKGLLYSRLQGRLPIRPFFSLHYINSEYVLLTVGVSKAAKPSQQRQPFAPVPMTCSFAHH